MTNEILIRAVLLDTNRPSALNGLVTVSDPGGGRSAPGGWVQFRGGPLATTGVPLVTYLMARLQYAGLMVACIVLTLPLEFVFGARVWRRPRKLAAAVLPVLAVFVIWDLWATHHGTWSFNGEYTIGWTLPGGMVVEELLFFVTIPLCTLLTLESVRNVTAGTTPVQRWLRSR